MQFPRTFGSLIAATIALSGTQAWANEQVPTTSIEMGDLDLTDQEDQAKLTERTERAIRTMCATNSRSVAALRLEYQCRQTALAQAETKVRLAIANAKTNYPRLAAKSKTNRDG